MKLEISDLKEIIKLAAHVVLLRHGDVSTENGNYATTDSDSMIRLDQAIADTFDLDSDDVTFENIDTLLGRIDDVFKAIEADQQVSESARLESIESRLESIERIRKPSYSVSKQDADAFQIQIVEEQTKEPEWRPMSTAPRECKCIKVKHAKTGEEYFASFFYDGWSCSLSRYKPDNTFLFFDSELSGWRHL